MYNQEKFINILKKIKNGYSLNEFARKTEVDVAYLWRIMNNKKTNPPTPKVLKRIAESSGGITTYDELMEVCGYIDLTNIYMKPLEKNVNCIPLLYKLDALNPELYTENNIIDYIPFYTDDKNLDNYFAYQINDDSLLPIVGKNDIVIIHKQHNFEYNHFFLITLDDNLILIRKITNDINNIKLQAVNPYYPNITLIDKDIKNRNFNVLGKVIKAENTSAFK